VVSVTTFKTEGDAYNVLPQSATVTGTVRTLAADVRDDIEGRLEGLISHTAKAFGANATVRYTRGYPVMVNSEAQTAFAAQAAGTVVGTDAVDTAAPAIMGGEDFAYMLEARPGSMVFVGNGDSEALHNPGYDFNDEIIPVGCSYWAQLVEQGMPLA